MRSVWIAYRNLKNLRIIEGIGYEKDVGGFPMATVPASMLGPSASSEERAVVAQIEKSLAQIRRGARSYVVFPAAVDELGNKTGYSLDFIGSSTGTANAAINTAIMRYQKAIALGLLADFMYLGTDKAGSFALSSDKTTMFIENIRGFFDKVTDDFNRQAVSALMRVNGVPANLWPTLTYTGLDAPDIERIGSYVERLFKVGVDVSDEETALWLRAVAGLPAIAPKEDPESQQNGPTGADATKADGKLRT